MKGKSSMELDSRFTTSGDIIISFPADSAAIAKIEEEVNEIKQRKGLDLEASLSYVLLYGVLIAMIVTSAGVIDFYIQNHSLEINQIVHVSSFAAYVSSATGAVFSGHDSWFGILSLGIIILMLTPYIRVLTSWVYFLVKERNTKYVVITLWVLVILTASLYLR
jgi:uncharacterized membrane protein